MLKVLLALVCIFILVAPGVTWWVAQRPVPVLEGVGEVNGLARPVLVRYDSRAIPYIKAESDEDLYAAQGYVVARERMFQMDMLRRAAEGRIAQVFGITALPADRIMRTIGFERIAEDELHSLTPQAKAAVEAYSRGVNAFINENAGKLSMEFTVLGYAPEPWREVDTLAVMKYLAYELDESWKLDELRWRVTNKVGDNMSARLFDDNVEGAAWSPEVKAKGGLAMPVPASVPTAKATAGSSATANSSTGTGSGANGVAAAAGPGARTLTGARAGTNAGSLTRSGTGTGTGARSETGATLRSSSTQGHGLSSRSSSGGTRALSPRTHSSDSTFGTSGSGQNSANPNRMSPGAGQLSPGPSQAPHIPGNELSDSFIGKFSLLAKQSEFFRKPDRSWGSTAWVISPQCSKSGGAMLASDKHSALTTPCEYFLCSLTSNGMHVAGAALPGVPGIMFGRNQYTCWSAASMHADVQDLFVEHFASDVESKYKTLAKVETATEIREAIPVRFGKDVEHKITITRHGPVLLRDKESAIALSWTGFETKKPWLNTVCALNHAQDWDSFIQALSTYGGPPQLFVFADKKGNTGCHAAGIIPVRAGGAQGTTMSEGWLSKGEWVSSVEFGDLPQSFIPAGTDKPNGDFCVAAGQKLYAAPGATGLFPQLWGHQWDPPFRANRLALSLPKNKNGQKLDLLDLNAYQGDDLNMMASLVVADLKKAIDANQSIDATQAKAMKVMQQWDFNIKRDSVAATCYESFVSTLARRLIEPQLEPELTNEYFQNWPLWITFVEDYLRKKPKDLLPKEERTADTFLITTFAKATTRLKLLFKNDKVDDTWSWDKAHLANFKSVGLQGLAYLRYVLDINGIGVGGDATCLDACDVDQITTSGPYKSNNGPAVRLLVDMSDDEAFYGNLALGQSGHYFSPYRQDQLKSWLRADPLPIAFSEDKIEKQSRQKFYLSAPGYR